jgi:hypothetical protein
VPVDEISRARRKAVIYLRRPHSGAGSWRSFPKKLFVPFSAWTGKSGLTLKMYKPLLQGFACRRALPVSQT